MRMLVAIFIQKFYLYSEGSIKALLFLTFDKCSKFQYYRADNPQICNRPLRH